MVYVLGLPSTLHKSVTTNYTINNFVGRVNPTAITCTSGLSYLTVGDFFPRNLKDLGIMQKEFYISSLAPSTLVQTGAYKLLWCHAVVLSLQFSITQF